MFSWKDLLSRINWTVTFSSWKLTLIRAEPYLYVSCNVLNKRKSMDSLGFVLLRQICFWRRLPVDDCRDDFNIIGQSWQGIGAVEGSQLSRPVSFMLFLNNIHNTKTFHLPDDQLHTMGKYWASCQRLKSKPSVHLLIYRWRWWDISFWAIWCRLWETLSV